MLRVKTFDTILYTSYFNGLADEVNEYLSSKAMMDAKNVEVKPITYTVDGSSCMAFIVTWEDGTVPEA